MSHIWVTLVTSFSPSAQCTCSKFFDVIIVGFESSLRRKMSCRNKYDSQEGLRHFLCPEEISSSSVYFYSASHFFLHEYFVRTSSGIHESTFHCKYPVAYTVVNRAKYFFLSLKQLLLLFLTWEQFLYRFTFLRNVPILFLLSSLHVSVNTHTFIISVLIYIVL